MDPVRDELLLTDDFEDTDDDGESDETDDVSITHGMASFRIYFSNLSLPSRDV